MAKKRKNGTKSIRNTRAIAILNGEKILINTEDVPAATEFIEKHKGICKFYCEKCHVEVVPRRAPYHAKRKSGHGPDYFFVAVTKHADDCPYNKSSKETETTTSTSSTPQMDILGLCNSHDPETKPLKPEGESEQSVDSLNEGKITSNSIEFKSGEKVLTTLPEIYTSINAMSADALINGKIMKCEVFIDRNYPDRHFRNDLSGQRIVVAKKVKWDSIPDEVKPFVNRGYICLINEDADYTKPRNVLYLLIRCERNWRQKEFTERVRTDPHRNIVIIANYKKVKSIHDLHVYKATDISGKQFMFINR
ncbi:MAG: hypothetical protein SPH34_04025 [Lachnospiraceae bacterium]|uniref:hypothetical protein n=1 Tax=Galactobacillus timonensis TaxID=2041840 RepID=UPI0023F32EF8|nr:hypothetical protein [Galactobacillus timonensis]MDD7086614.1 hypothetical protein [Galactobacillus timonensis]MDY5222467.1 hypothetical protein [Lachnospiraceae bacterium]